MKSRLLLCLLLLLLVLPLEAKDKPPAFKSIEVTHFPYQEGVELSPEFSDFLYGSLVEALETTKMFEEIAEEGEYVDPADASRSLILQGTVLEYGKGSVAKTVLIGFGAGRRSLRTSVTVSRHSDRATLYEKELKVRAPKLQDEKALARNMAKKIAKDIKKRLRD